MNFNKVSLVGIAYLEAINNKKTKKEELAAHKRRFDACLKEYVDISVKESLAEIKEKLEDEMRGF